MNLCHKKILLVEDDPAHVELILRAFQDRSDALNLTLTRLLSEALDLVSHTPPDLVITDLVLPDGQGVELLKNGQFHPHYPPVPSAHNTHHTSGTLAPVIVPV